MQLRVEVAGSGGLFVPNKARKGANAWPPRGVSGSVGPVGDTYDDALADSVTGLFKTELIKPRGAVARQTTT